MNWLLKLIFKAIGQLLTAVLQAFANIFNDVFEEMYQVFKELNLDTVSDFTVGIGIAILTMVAMKQLFEVYVLETEGDASSDPLEILTRISVAVATILCGNQIIDFMISGASQFVKELCSNINSNAGTKDFSKSFGAAISEALDQATILAFVIIILFVVIIVAYVIFLFKAAKRGAELILFQLVLPFIACDLITESKERWKSFKSELILCIFGYAVQMFCFNVFLMLIAKIGTDFQMKYIIGSITWLVLVLSAPKWLQKFTYSSGIGGMAKGVVRTSTSMLPSLLRK